MEDGEEENEEEDFDIVKNIMKKGRANMAKEAAELIDTIKNGGEELPEGSQTGKALALNGREKFSRENKFLDEKK